MKLLIQRVDYASVQINGGEIRKSKKGLLVYLGIKKDEDISKIDKAIDKLLSLGFFENEEGKLKLSVVDIKGDIMLIPNFSLYGKAKKGRTLSFDDGARANEASEIFELFSKKIKEKYENIVYGEFKTDMHINSLAIGPINVILEF